MARFTAPRLILPHWHLWLFSRSTLSSSGQRRGRKHPHSPCAPTQVRISAFSSAVWNVIPQLPVFKMAPEEQTRICLPVFLWGLQFISWSAKTARQRQDEVQRRCISGEERVHGFLAKWIKRAGSLDGNYRHRIQHPVKEAELVCTFFHEHGEV